MRAYSSGIPELFIEQVANFNHPMDTSAEIRELYKRDKKEVFRRVFDTYRDNLYLFALGLLSDPCAAEDVVHDCFADFWANDRMKNVSGDIGKYLLGAVQHASLNHIRRSKRLDSLHRKFGADDSGQAAELEPEYLSGMRRIYEALGSLPAQRRRIFLMIAVEGMRYRAVADAMGISINTVKTQMKRAVGTLREAFGKP